jgi:hypothetical protein
MSVNGTIWNNKPSSVTNLIEWIKRTALHFGPVKTPSEI